MKNLRKPLTLVPLFLLAFLSLSGQQRERVSRFREKAKPMTYTETVDHAQHSVASIIREGERGIATAIGTAFFINEEGYLVTNAHVIREALALRSQGTGVGLYFPVYVPGTNRIGGMDAPGFRIVAVDDDYDVAVLKTEDLRRKPGFFKLSVTGVPPGTELAYTGFPLAQDYPVTVACRAATQGIREPMAQVLSHGPKISGSFFLIDVPIHRGHSGSGVYLMENGVVVGIASGSFLAPVETQQGPAGNVGTGAFGYVRPLRRLVEILDEKKIVYSRVSPIDEFVQK